MKLLKRCLNLLPLKLFQSLKRKRFKTNKLKCADYYEGFEVSLWVKAKHYEASELVLEHMMKYKEDTTVELLGFIDVVARNKAKNSE